jgi:phage recombination protein Bet
MNERLPIIASARIPYHPIVQERYGIAPESWRALTDAVFPSAQSIEGVILALSYCKSRNLDVFKRPVHIVPIWNSDQNRYVETVWPGIGELRTTAFRTGDYAGADPATFGPDITHEFSGEIGRSNNKRHVSVRVTFPEWCQVTVYRTVRGQPRPWPGPRVYWLETYSRMGRSDVPNDMWQKRARGQLEKCAEAAALRKAFPEEIGEQYISDEIGEDMKDITPAREMAAQAPMAGNGASADPMDEVVARARQDAPPSFPERAGPPTPRREDAPQSRPEPRTAPAAAGGSDARAEAPAPTGGQRAAAQGAKKRGRPTNAELAERKARDIIAEIGECHPADIDGLMQTHDEAIAGLPDELRTEVVTAAQHRMEQAVAEPEQAPVYDPETGEVPPEADDDDADDRYAAWVAAVREQVRSLPLTMAHLGPKSPYRQGRLAECDQWEDREDAEREVNDAFDAKLRQLQGGGQ